MPSTDASIKSRILQLLAQESEKVLFCIQIYTEPKRKTEASGRNKKFGFVIEKLGSFSDLNSSWLRYACVSVKANGKAFLHKMKCSSAAAEIQRGKSFPVEEIKSIQSLDVISCRFSFPFTISQIGLL